jgi:hypothetical protein
MLSVMDKIKDFEKAEASLVEELLNQLTNKGITVKGRKEAHVRNLIPTIKALPIKVIMEIRNGGFVKLLPILVSYDEKYPVVALGLINSPIVKEEGEFYVPYNKPVMELIMYCKNMIEV